jgi:hypothetical protein
MYKQKEKKEKQTHTHTHTHAKLNGQICKNNNKPTTTTTATTTNENPVYKSGFLVTAISQDTLGGTAAHDCYCWTPH